MCDGAQRLSESGTAFRARRGARSGGERFAGKLRDGHPSRLRLFGESAFMLSRGLLNPLLHTLTRLVMFSVGCEAIRAV